MNRKSMLALLLISALSIAALAPTSSASSVSVNLNPESNSATVHAYINSSVELAANSSIPGFYQTLQGIASTSDRNITISATNIGNTTLVYSILNSSISEKEQGAYLSSLSLSYERTVYNITGSSGLRIFVNGSLGVQMTVSGIFHGNTANLTWRSFETNRSLNISGENINQVNFSGNTGQSDTVFNTLNMSVFSKSLLQWNRSYDSASNTTTYSLDAGNTVHFSGYYNTSEYSVALTFNIDPTYSISAPGYDTANNNAITIGNPPHTNPVIYYSILAVLLGGGLITFYFRRKGTGKA